MQLVLPSLGHMMPLSILHAAMEEAGTGHDQSTFIENAEAWPQKQLLAL